MCGIFLKTGKKYIDIAYPGGAIMKMAGVLLDSRRVSCFARFRLMVGTKEGLELLEN